MGGKKKFSFVSVILSVICVVFVCEAAALAAALGNRTPLNDENVEYSAKAELHAALDALEQL